MAELTRTPLTVERLEAHLDAMGWDRPRAMAEDLAPLVAEHLTVEVAAVRADERERIMLAVQAELCARHQFASPTPQPCAACSHDAQTLTGWDPLALAQPADTEGA